MSKPGITQRVALSAAAALLVVCCCASTRFAYADIFAATGTVDGLRKAIGLVPWNADYYRLLGAALEWEGEAPDGAFLQAVQLNPRDSQVLIRLAQSRERHGNPQQAERYLLQAAHIDHMFDPRWALANFYFRRGNFDGFWKWAALALERSYGDGRSVFELCAQAPDGVRRLQALIPPEPDALSKYLRFLVAARYTGSMAAVAGQLASFRRAGDRDLLLGACDRLIDSGRGGEARLLWGTLIQKGLIDDRSTRGNLVVNGELSKQPLEIGFDWRKGDCADVELEPLTREPGLKLSFEGSQAEHCDVLTQYVLLPDAKLGSFRFEYQVAPDEAGAFGWSVCAGARCSSLEGVVAKQLANGWTRIEGQLSPMGHGLVRLVFGYQRPVGRTRYRGELRLRGIELAAK